MRYIYIGLGFLFLGLGALGTTIPLLPTTPFLLAASFFFAKGSDRFNCWFASTKLYQKYLAEFVKNRAMTFKNKIFIASLGIVPMTIAALVIDNGWAQAGLIFLIAVEIWYFTYCIKTIELEDSKK